MMRSSHNQILDAWITVEELSEGNIEKSDSKYKIFQGDDYQSILKDFFSLSSTSSSYLSNDLNDFP